MKAAILYSSQVALSGPAQTVVSVGKTGVLFVRAEKVECEDLCDALSKANPREGETVLNTVEISGCEGHAEETSS